MKKYQINQETPYKDTDTINQTNRNTMEKNVSVHVEGSKTTEFTRQLASEIVRNLSHFGKITFRPFTRSTQSHISKAAEQYAHPILLDTSALIDGRIVPLVKSGLVNGTIIISDLVLAELRHISDSDDPVRRTKGRRGLEAVQLLQKNKNTTYFVKVTKTDTLSDKETDDKLVSYAQIIKALFVTYDFNLAQVARAKGVKVLHLNELFLALRLTVTAGEEFTLTLTHEGKEKDQGVGYLPDGTMVIVERAKLMVGHNCQCIVTKIHQTPAGQILFARMK